MRTTAVIFLLILCSSAIAQDNSEPALPVTQKEIEEVRSFLKRSNWNNLNKAVQPVYTTRSLSKMRDSLSKKKVGNTISVVTFLGHALNGDRLTGIHIDSRINKKEIPFSYFKIIKNQYTLTVVELSGTSIF